MAVTFDNPTNVNGLIIVAFKSDENQAVTLDASPYMREIYSVVVNTIGQGVVARSTFDNGSNPFELHIPICVELSGTTVTLKQVNGNVGTITSTIEGKTSGIIIGRK
tara:strand:+ start:503 stop:823 length:321 start_codon:yes stop_codon:yes gene_type:complete